MIHLELQEGIDREFAGALAGRPELCQDALLVRLDNDAVAELRFFSADEYSIGWRWGDAELRIDTAPVHPGLATFPNHLHDAEGAIRPDPLTRPGAEPWDNVRAVLGALLKDPLLTGA